MNKPLEQPQTKMKNGCCCANQQPSIVAPIVKDSGDLPVQKFKVEGASCGACVGKIERALLTASGVKQARMDLSTGTATVTGTVDSIDSADLIRALAQAGFVATPINTTPTKNNTGSYDE